MHGQRPTECTTKRRYSSGAPLRKPPAEEWRWPTVSTFFLAVNAWFSLATSATVPPLQSGLGTFDLGSVLCILPYAPPLGSAFPPENKILYTQKKKKKAKRKKEKKKKRLLTFDAELTRSVFSLYFFVPRYWCERRTRGRVRGGASYFLPVAA